MARPTLLLAAVCLLVGLAGVEARADERIVGPGYAFDLPERFRTTAGTWEVVARATCETLVQGLPFRPASDPRMRFYAVPAEGAPEAILVVCRFDLKPGDALTSIDDLPVASIRAAHQHAMDTLPGGKLKQTLREQLGGYLPAIASLFTYPHPSAGERTVHTGIVVSDCTGVLLLLDAPSELRIEYQTYFASVADSLRVLKPAPGLLEELKYPIYGVAGLLGILLVVLFVMRSRRATRRAALPDVRPRMRVISVDAEPGAASVHGPPPSAASPQPPEGETKSRAGPIELSPAAAISAPRREVAAAAPASKSRLRDTLAERAWERERSAAPTPADDPSEQRDEDEPAAPRAGTGGQEPRTPTLRIRRNTDFLED